VLFEHFAQNGQRKVSKRCIRRGRGKDYREGGSGMEKRWWDTKAIGPGKRSKQLERTLLYQSLRKTLQKKEYKNRGTQEQTLVRVIFSLRAIPVRLGGSRFCRKARNGKRLPASKARRSFLWRTTGAEPPASRPRTTR